MSDPAGPGPLKQSRRTHLISENSLAIALGSNLGDRSGYLDRARSELNRLIGSVPRQSYIYETDPIGPGDQRPYLNQVLLLETTLEPVELLTITLGIERNLKRERNQRWGPRTIDLDLLLYGNRVLETAELTLPHPRLHERPFVLIPLMDLLPDWRHPLTGYTVAEMQLSQGSAGVKRWHPNDTELEE